MRAAFLALAILLSGPSVQVLSAADWYLSSRGSRDPAFGTSPTDRDLRQFFLSRQGPSQPVGGADSLAMIIPLLQPGDTVHLATGSTFRGPLVFGLKARKSHPVRFVSWGEGDAPVISDMIPAGPWAPAGPGLWKSPAPSLATGASVAPPMLVRDGTMLPLGRYPDGDAPWGGYLPVESHDGPDRIRNASLPAGTDWTGAELVLRPRRWILDRRKILSRNGPDMTLAKGHYEPYDGFGFFLQDHPACLDRDGEWCHTPDGILLRQDRPPLNDSLTIPSSRVLMDLAGSSWVELDGLEFHGSGTMQIRLDDTRGLTIRNCRFLQGGKDGLRGWGISDMTFRNNLVADMQSCGLVVDNGKGVIIEGNQFRHIAMVPGMGGSGDGEYCAIIANGDNMRIESNHITETGYLPLSFNGSHVQVLSNRIDGYCLVKDDGGGIYTWSDGKSPMEDRVVSGNRIRGGRGAPDGQGWEGAATQGIYLDDRTLNVTVADNLVEGAADNGIFLHNAARVVVRNNRFLGNGQGFSALHDAIAPEHPVHDVAVEGNLFAVNKPGQALATLGNSLDGILPAIRFRGNRWLDPFDSPGAFTSGSGNFPIRHHDPAAWSRDQDPEGTYSPVTLPVRQVLPQNPASPKTPLASSSTGNWNWWASAGNGSVRRMATAVHRISFSTPSGNEDSRILWYSPSFPVRSGRTFLLTFRMRASTDIHSTFLLRRNQEPWNSVATETGMEVSTGWTWYSFLLDTTKDEPGARAEFTIPEADFGSSRDRWVEIAEVELAETEVRMADWPSRLMWACNHGTEPLTVELAGPWRDSFNRERSGRVVLSPGEGELFLAPDSHSAR